MSHDIFHDPRLRSVHWRDLVPVTRLEIGGELLLPAVWLAGSLLVAERGYYAIALGLSFMFFLAGLRVVHNAFHSALGLSAPLNSGVLWIMSLIMLGSMHAVRFNHLRHHRLMLDEGDVEGRAAEMPAWRAMLWGPVFPILLHSTAFRYGNAKLRAIIAAELLMTVVWTTLVFGVWHSSTLRYHVVAMADRKSVV
jgi:fatty acid desaturase